jgi:arylsulfatase A-like enzyme
VKKNNTGPTSNAPLRAGKGWPYEGGVREPMIVCAPGIAKPGSTCDAPVISTDYYPTLLQLAGLPMKPEQHLDGTSFLPVLKGEPSQRTQPLFWHYPHYHGSGSMPNGAIRDGDWKLIEWFEDGSLELYNLAQDLSEQHNLAAQQPAKVEELHAKLVGWRKQVGALMPTARTDTETKPTKKRKGE